MSPRMPQVTPREMVAFLKSKGFVPDRQVGSHLTLRHPLRGSSVTVPMHSSADLGRGLAMRILKDAGLTIGEYLRDR